VRKVLDEMIGKSGSSEAHDDDDRKALTKAIEFEARGAKFYMKIARLCVGRPEKSFFEFLSRIEREHQLSLADTLAYLNDPGAG